MNASKVENHEKRKERNQRFRLRHILVACGLFAFCFGNMGRSLSLIDLDEIVREFDDGLEVLTASLQGNDTFRNASQIPSPTSTVTPLISPRLLAQTDNERNASQQPPHTAGAFIHVGKTGGSTLSEVLRNPCHSRIANPCNPNIPNQTLLSWFTTYYHIPDFVNGKISEYPYDFYVITVRDPLERTISAFVYQHPMNIKARRQAKFTRDVYFLREAKQALGGACFESLETFASHLGVPPSNNTRACSTRAHTLLTNQEPLIQHLYFDMKKIMSLLPHPQTPMLVIRTEHLWDDWVSANRRLGQTGPIATKRVTRNRDFNSTAWEPRVTKDLSDQGRAKLCHALVDEYRAYLLILQRAINLTDKERQESLDYSRQKCPELNLQFDTNLPPS